MSRQTDPLALDQPNYTVIKDRWYFKIFCGHRECYTPTRQRLFYGSSLLPESREDMVSLWVYDDCLHCGLLCLMVHPQCWCEGLGRTRTIRYNWTCISLWICHELSWYQGRRKRVSLQLEWQNKTTCDGTAAASGTNCLFSVRWAWIHEVSGKVMIVPWFFPSLSLASWLSLSGAGLASVLLRQGCPKNVPDARTPTWESHELTTFPKSMDESCMNWADWASLLLPLELLDLCQVRCSLAGKAQVE